MPELDVEDSVVFGAAVSADLEGPLWLNERRWRKIVHLQVPQQPVRTLPVRRMYLGVQQVAGARLERRNCRMAADPSHNQERVAWGSKDACVFEPRHLRTRIQGDGPRQVQSCRADASAKAHSQQDQTGSQGDLSAM